MSQLIEQLRERYELVLVDAPPVLPFADAVAAMPACDGAIMVVRYGKTHIAQLRQASDALEASGSAILGSVLSMTPASQHPKYDYSYRRYRPAHDDPPQAGPPVRGDEDAPASEQAHQAGQSVRGDEDSKTSEGETSEKILASRSDYWLAVRIKGQQDGRGT